MKDGSATTASTPARNRRSPPSPPPPEAAAGVRCPRCDSANTKFCYYNNYSLTQPRHFCKTCRRYWTKGGALRNVPIGGGCRKNKKPKPSPEGLKFFEGLSPAMDFQISGIGASPPPPFPRFLHHNTHQIGFGFPAAGGAYAPVLGGAVHDDNSNMNNIASSIESLSFMNQDLHWKLQQQRLALLFGNGGEREQDSNVNGSGASEQRGGDVAAGWFFGNSYGNQAAVGGGGSEVGQGAAVGSWNNNGFGGWSDHS